MELTTEKLVREKKDRIISAIELQEYDRPPIVAVSGFWPVSYVGKYSMQEAFYDVDKVAECYEEVLEDFPEWDGLSALMLSLGPMLDATGSRRYIIPGQSISEDAEFQHPDLTLMEVDEYPQLIEDPIGFLVGKIIPRLCPRLAEPEPGKTKALTKAAIYHAQFSVKTRAYFEKWAEKYGVPRLFHGSIAMPIDIIADKLRGFQQGLMDIKRNSEMLQEACEALVPFAVQTAIPFPAPDVNFPIIFNPQHVSAFISPKDYEKCYWPSFKKIVDILTGKGYKLFIHFEGNQEQHLEILQELPRGKVVAQFEGVDMARVKKYLGGKLCVAGGMPGTLLTRGTPDEVREHTRNVLELFADTGGLIVTCDINIPINAKRENIRTWINTVKGFKL